jgi:hypothetical protein
MTPTIDPTDPRYFIQSSDKSYDRHEYLLSFSKGERQLVFQDYEQLRSYWFECARNWSDGVVQVLDIKKNKKEKKSQGGGFK